MSLDIKAENGDRRVQRTRRALRFAVVSLLAERGWDGVSLPALCEPAGVGGDGRRPATSGRIDAGPHLHWRRPASA
jgi:hypothetical protein